MKVYTFQSKALYSNKRTFKKNDIIITLNVTGDWGRVNSIIIQNINFKMYIIKIKYVFNSVYSAYCLKL